MKTWLVTGGAGCGKSVVTAWLGKHLGLGVKTFSADSAVSDELKKLAVVERLVETFGPQLRLSSGEVNRDWLRIKILPFPSLRKTLEGILHPPVLASLEAARAEVGKKTGANLFLAEVPLHYEIGATVSADFVIVVASSRSVQVRRMMETRGLDEQTVHQFLAAQWPIEAKVERADAVIWNDGSLASLEAQVLTLASPLLQA